MQRGAIRLKVKGKKALKQALISLRKKGKRIVFTNGCFDLLHPGHIAYLKKARSFGDLLVVGLNSDNSVKALKGKGRPITPERKRAEVLASLEFVDLVTIFNDLTPAKLIKDVRPHTLVKGADWRKSDIVGKDFVESYGGRVRRITYIKGYSTSSLIKNICRKFGR